MCIRDSYKDVDERTSAHELYGYKVALRDLGLLDREDCYVLPDTFGEARGRSPRSRRSSSPMCATTFEHLHPDLKRHRETAKIYALGLALSKNCPPNDCRVYLNIFNAARELDAALDGLDAYGAPALALRKELRERVGELAEMMEDNYAVEQYRKGGGAK